MTLLAISADSHITEPGDCYVDRIDPKFRDRAPIAVTDETMGATMLIDNGRSRLPYGMVAGAGRPTDKIHPHLFVPWEELHPGGWNPEERLKEQDRDGVAAEVIYPSVGMILCNHPDADYKKACFDAYNLWITEFQSADPARLIGLGQTALRSVDEGIADLVRIKDMGLHGVMMPGYASCHDEGDYDDPRWDPLWRAAVELRLPLSFHILTSGNDQPTNPQFRGPKMNSFLGIIRGCQDIVGTFVFGGVFERHPDLRIVCVEADAGWAPHWAYRADHAYNRHRNWLPAEITRLPSEYFFENVYLTFQDDWIAFKTRHLMNHERLCWASDHPHSDATFPNSQAILREHTADMDETERDDILWRYTARLYGLTVTATA
jgi:predicted TIM-barrel fold metal-dependent hydrolase